MLVVGAEMPGGDGGTPRRFNTEVLRTTSDGPSGSGAGTRRGTVFRGASVGVIGGRGPLEGGLPDAGAIIALADVATDRLYVVVEGEEGAMHLELSDMLARDELANPGAAVRLALRRTVRSRFPTKILLLGTR